MSAVRTARPATYEELGLSRQRVAEWRELRDAGESVIDEAIQAALDEGRAPTNADVQRAVEARHHRTQFTGENEWYTPRRVHRGGARVPRSHRPGSGDRARRAGNRQGGALLHPRQRRPAPRLARTHLAQPAVLAAGHRALRRQAARRDRRRPGSTKAILLTHNYTDTGWFHAAAGQCAAICFTRGRIRFVSATGGIAAPTQGQAFFYFGAGVDRFRDTFGGFGFIR